MLVDPNDEIPVASILPFCSRALHLVPAHTNLVRLRARLSGEGWQLGVSVVGQLAKSQQQRLGGQWLGPVAVSAQVRVQGLTVLRASAHCGLLLLLHRRVGELTSAGAGPPCSRAPGCTG